MNPEAESMNIVIEKDHPRGAFARYCLPMLLGLAALAVINALLHLSWAVSFALACFVVPFSLWSFHARNNWGDQLVFGRDQLTVRNSGENRFAIPAATVSAKSARDKVALIAWLDGGKRKVLVIGRESFSVNNWQQLSLALAAFGA